VDIDGALTQDGGAVFNEDSADVDFRVESNGNTHMLFVDGGNNKIGIGNNSPNTSLHIRSATASNIGGYRDGTTSLIVEGDTASYIQFVANKQAPMGLLFDGGDTHNDSARGGVTYDIDTGLSFKSGGSTRWTIDETGNLLPSATSLGVYLGVTSATASNLLDDYEEGIFTPAFSSTSATFSYNYQSGNYTRVGRLVMCSFLLQLGGSTSGTTSNSVSITGLPFSSATLQGTYHGGSFGHYFNFNLSQTGVLAYQTHSGGSSVELKVVGDNLGETAVLASHLASNAGIRGQIIYHAS
jgi:hypothetical protein